MNKFSIIISIFFLNVIFTNTVELNETRFEKFWKRTFKKMSFRDPIIIMPYNIKVGHYSYGGSRHWKQWEEILSGEDVFISSPFNLKNQNFPNFRDHKYSRKGYTLELDILRYNYFKKFQNIVDVQLGVGYKYSKTIHSSSYEGIRSKPSFHEINVNSTFIFQWDPKYFTYLYYSIGPTKATLYGSDDGDGYGKGITQGFGIGLNFLTSSQVKNNNINYGFEIRKEDCKIDDIEEAINHQYINSFHMSKIALIFSFGISQGGKSTLGDEAFINILNENYILALEQLNQFKYENPYPGKNSQINNMILLCRSNIAGQMYNEAMDKYYKNYFEESLELLNKASFYATKELKYQIESKKYIIANQVLDDSNIRLQSYSIDEQIDFFEHLTDLSPRLKTEVNKKISNLLMRKGDLFFENKDYEESFNLYFNAIEKDFENKNLIDIKINNMVTLLINNIYNFLQNKEYVIAYEHLSLIKDISRENDASLQLMEIINKGLENQKISDIRNRVKTILSIEKEFVAKFDSNKIFLGDTYDNVINILGIPKKKIEKEKLGDNYEMLIFVIDGITHRLFFRNQILIDAERVL